MAGARAIVIGSDRLGLRIGQQLERDGCVVALIALPGSWLAEAALPATWQVWRARPDAPDVLEAAGLRDTDVLLAVSDVDELNLGTALAARAARPGLRLVVRQFNVRLGRLLGRYLPEARILSLSHATAPTFALAALVPGVVFAHDTGHEQLVLREVPAGEMPRPEEALLAAAGASGVRWGSDGGAATSATRVLVASRATDAPRHARRAAPAVPTSTARGSERGDDDRLLPATLAALVIVLFGVALVFAARLGLSPLDAVYFVSTILTTVGFGDFNLRDADPATKLVGIVTMFAGLFLSALLVGLVTNKLIARQQARRRGHFRMRLEDHVVVCGLGTLGVRIAQALRRLGQPVVAVDPEPREGFAATLRAAGVPLVIGDATQERVLAYANLGRARALIAATSRDHLNLEIALVARSIVPDVPVVLRFFDADLCGEVATTFGIDATFSGATLGAAVFTAFTTGDARLACLRFAGAAYELHRLAPTSVTSVRDLVVSHGGLPVAVADARGCLRLHPPDDTTLAPGDALLVVIPEPAAMLPAQR